MFDLLSSFQNTPDSTGLVFSFSFIMFNKSPNLNSDCIRYKFRLPFLFYFFISFVTD